MANQAPFFTAIWASNSSSSSFRNWEMNTWRLFLESAQKGLYRCVEQFTSQIHSIRALDSCASHTVCVWDLQPKTCWDKPVSAAGFEGLKFFVFFLRKDWVIIRGYQLKQQLRASSFCSSNCSWRKWRSHSSQFITLFCFGTFRKWSWLHPSFSPFKPS